jgi:hypothetical protein
VGTLHWQVLVDFIALAGAILLLLRWSQQARALRLSLAIVHCGGWLSLRGA